LARIKAIDRDLSVEWVVPPGRWAVFHALQVDGRYDETVDLLARQLQDAGANAGHLWPLSDCAMKARRAVHAGKLVCYVTDDDGGYRSLDQRIVTKLQRMDWIRQNLGLKDFRAILKAKADHLREQETKTVDDMWDTIRRDRVLEQHVSDILWGLKTVRTVIVPANFKETSHHALTVSSA
jgi:hypothetical protein